VLIFSHHPPDAKRTGEDRGGSWSAPGWPQVQLPVSGNGSGVVRLRRCDGWPARAGESCI